MRCVGVWGGECVNIFMDDEQHVVMCGMKFVSEFLGFFFKWKLSFKPIHLKDLFLLSAATDCHPEK